MNTDNQQKQAPQSCCGDANEPFDCTAMMERLKRCCENSQPQDQSSCCAEILQICCGTSDEQSGK